jgi:hypothetical protein
MMSNFTWAGFWNGGTAYQTNTFVTYENVVYHQVEILIGILLCMVKVVHILKELHYQQ